MTSKSRLLSIIFYLILGFSTVLYLLFAAKIMSEGPLINWCYVLFGISVVVVIVFPVISMVSNLKAARNSIIGLLALMLIFVIGWFMSSGETYKLGEIEVGETASKSIEAGLISFYILMVLAVIVIIYAEVSKALK